MVDFDGHMESSLCSLSKVTILGDIDLLRRLVSDGRAEDHQDNKGWRAIHHAVNLKNISALSLLLSCDATNVNWESHERITALHLACKGLPDSLPLLRALLDAPDIKVNLIEPYGGNPLHFAINAARDKAIEAVKLLVMKGVDVSARDGNMDTPLNLAASCDHTGEIVSFLLSKGADVFLKNLGDFTPLISACEAGNTAAVKAILEFMKSTPMKLKELIDTMSSTPFITTALHSAIRADSLGCVRELLKSGADSNIAHTLLLLPALEACISAKKSTKILDAVLKFANKNLIYNEKSRNIFSLAVHNTSAPKCLEILLRNELCPSRFSTKISEILCPIRAKMILEMGYDKVSPLSEYLMTYPIATQKDLNVLKPLIDKTIGGALETRKTFLPPIIAFASNNNIKTFHYEALKVLGLTKRSSILKKELKITSILSVPDVKKCFLKNGILKPQDIEANLMTIENLIKSSVDLKNEKLFLGSTSISVYVHARCFGSHALINRIRKVFPLNLMGPKPYNFDAICQFSCSNPRQLYVLARNVCVNLNIDPKQSNFPEPCLAIMRYEDLWDKEFENLFGP